MPIYSWVTTCLQDMRRVYMVLDYAPGGDALAFVQKHGALPETRARKWLLQLASAVFYLHTLGVTHRDLKLENLLIDQNGTHLRTRLFPSLSRAYTKSHLPTTAHPIPHPKCTAQRKYCWVLAGPYSLFTDTRSGYYSIE